MMKSEQGRDRAKGANSDEASKIASVAKPSEGSRCKNDVSHQLLGWVERQLHTKIRPHKGRPAQEVCKPGRAFGLPVHPRSGRSEHNSGRSGAPVAYYPPRRSWRVTSLGSSVATADPRGQ